VFLLIVLFSPDGLLGLWAKLRSRFGPNQTVISTTRRQA
jgi:branched-chain amino acid transport system permease protein